MKAYFFSMEYLSIAFFINSGIVNFKLNSLSINACFVEALHNINYYPNLHKLHNEKLYMGFF
jgi:hypothetical protein